MWAKYIEETRFSPHEETFYFDKEEQKAAEKVNQVLSKLESEYGFNLSDLSAKEVFDLIDAIEAAPNAVPVSKVSLIEAPRRMFRVRIGSGCK